MRAAAVSAELGANLPTEFNSETNCPECARVIGDIRDQGNCGCCWAFGAAEVASDRACIASGGAIAMPMSASCVCFNAEWPMDGCGGGTAYYAFTYMQSTGVVTGGQ